MSKRRIIVTGSRSWYCREVAERVIGSLVSRHDRQFVIVHGAAPGVDSAFKDACERMGVEHEPHPADWKLHGKAAGPIRNAEMVALGAEYAIASVPDLLRSKGTLGCTKLCMEAGIPVYQIDGVSPTRRLKPEDLEVS